MKKKVKEALKKAKKLEKKPFPTKTEISNILADLEKQEKRLHQLMNELSGAKPKKPAKKAKKKQKTSVSRRAKQKVYKQPTSYKRTKSR